MNNFINKLIVEIEDEQLKKNEEFIRKLIKNNDILNNDILNN